VIEGALDVLLEKFEARRRDRFSRARPCGAGVLRGIYARQKGWRCEEERLSWRVGPVECPSQGQSMSIV
jgi:hypothetical protein